MLTPKHRLATAALMLGLSLLPMQSCPSKAATTSVSDNQAIEKNVASMETRFFARQYANDPIEKRLERIELLVFGSTQAGDTQERFERLKKAIVARDSQNAAGAAGNAAKGGAQTGGSSVQYTAINKLESRLLKKTYPGEPLSSRLSRLEKKVFGADNPAMSYADRVDRLKRTLQGAVASQQPSPSFAPPLGPAPKARPRGQDGSDYFSFGFPNDDFFGDGGMGMPGMPGLPNLSNMMRQMEQEMRQFEGAMPPGGSIRQWHREMILDPKTGKWTELTPGGKPGKEPNISPFKAPSMPQFKFGPGGTAEPPPYSDPNVI